MAINWSLAAQPVNAFNALSQGYAAGQKQRGARERRNALAMFGTDPEAATNALMAAGDVETANALIGVNDKMDSYRGRKASRPYMEKGDYAGAARAAAGYDPELAAQINKMDADQKDRLYTLGQRSASVLMAAAQLPDPQQRRDFIGQNAEELTGLGLTPEQIANYDVSNPAQMRATAARFMELRDLAGKSSVEKVGDYNVTYETNPVMGTRPVSKTEIPATRAERLAADRYTADRDYRQERLGLDRESLDLRRQEAERPTMGQVQGEVAAKKARGEPLSQGEQEVWDYMQSGRTNGFGFPGMMGGYPGASPAPAAPPPPSRTQEPARKAAPVPQNNGVYQPTTEADMAQIPKGARFVNPATGEVLVKAR